jgi:uncharacterized RDD family membrane protein YckC
MRLSLPEQVSIELPVASYGSRGLAYAIDFFIRWITVAAVVMVIAYLSIRYGLLEGYLDRVIQKFNLGSEESSLTIAISLALVFFFSVEWSYPLYFEVVKAGVTPGKRMLGLRVVDEQGLPPAFQAALIRTAFLIVDALPWPFGGVALISMSMSKNSQRLGDMVGGTLVIYDEQIKTTDLNSNRNIADVTLPFEHFSLLEQFITRRKWLDPSSRERIRQALSAELRSFLESNEQPLPDGSFTEETLEKLLQRAQPEKRTVLN